MRSTEIPEHFRDVHQVTQRSGRDVKIIPTLLFVGKVRLNKMPKVRFQIRCGAGNREQSQTLSTHGLNSNVWNGKTLPCWEFTFEITLQKAGLSSTFVFFLQWKLVPLWAMRGLVVLWMQLCRCLGWASFLLTLNVSIHAGSCGLLV